MSVVTRATPCCWCPKWRLLVVAGVVGAILIVATVLRVFQEDQGLGFTPNETALEASSTSYDTTGALFRTWKDQLGCNGEGESLTTCSKKIQRIVEKEAADQVKLAHVAGFARYRNQSDPYPIIKLVNEHPALVPLLPQYQPDPAWRDSAYYTDFNVVGLAKAGTSQLYRILAQHADAQPLHPTEKEFCMLGAVHTLWELQDVTSTIDARKEQVQANLFRWHSGLAAILQNLPSKKPTVNGCVNWHDLWLHLHYARPTNKKYFVLLRDPADWLFSTYNFWIDEALDSRLNGNEKEWADSKKHYRSPELFHELIVSDTRTRSGANMLIGLKQSTAVYGKRLVQLVGRDQVLFLRNEDLLPERIDVPGGALDQVSDFTGLHRGKFHQQGLHSFANCNDAKGFTQECNDDKASRGVYEISGNRTMLEATRRFIYYNFWEECKIWAKEFGIYYPDCLNVMETTSD